MEEVGYIFCSCCGRETYDVYDGDRCLSCYTEVNERYEDYLDDLLGE